MFDFSFVSYLLIFLLGAFSQKIVAAGLTYHSATKLLYLVSTDSLTYIKSLMKVAIKSDSFNKEDFSAWHDALYVELKWFHEKYQPHINSTLWKEYKSATKRIN